MLSKDCYHIVWSKALGKGMCSTQLMTYNQKAWLCLHNLPVAEADCDYFTAGKAQFTLSIAMWCSRGRATDGVRSGQIHTGIAVAGPK